MSRFTILLAGRIDPVEALRQAVADTRVIAADAGIRHAEALGVRPELWVGDFDSAGPAAQGGQFGTVPRLVLPRDKAATDGEAAAEAAIGRGATSLLLVGALGGPRSDHAFSNLVLALRYAEAGLAVELFDGAERAVPLGPEPVRFETRPGAQFSILKFSDVSGLTVSGAKWPLDTADLAFGSILTQSNEALGPIEVRVRRGRALLLMQTPPD